MTRHTKRMSVFLLATLMLAPLAKAQQVSPAMQALLDLQEEVRQLKAKVEQLEGDLKMAKIQIHGLREQVALLEEQSPAMADGSDPTPAADNNKPTGDVWLVDVADISELDTGDLQMRLSREQANLHTIRKQLDQARNRLLEYSEKERVRTREYYNAGRWHYDYETRYKYGRAAYDDAQATVRKLEGDEKQALRMVRRTEQEIKRAGEERIITGRTHDGKTVKVMAKGSAVHVAKTMVSQQWYQISGPGREISGTIQIHMISATPVDPPGPAAE